MKKNRFYKILALVLVMTLALFLTPTAFASDDDDLPPLIPSKNSDDDDLPPLLPPKNIDDLDDLPPLIPKNPPGKEPPTKPPIEIEVPDDGDDLDIDLTDEDEMEKRKETSVWTFTIITNASGPIPSASADDEGIDFSHVIYFNANMLSQSTMFGNYTGEGFHSYVITYYGDFIREYAANIEGSFEILDWADDDSLPPLGPSHYPKGYYGPGSNPDRNEDPDDVGFLFPKGTVLSMAGYGEGFMSDSEVNTGGVEGFKFNIYVYENGLALMRALGTEFMCKFSQKLYWDEVA